MQINVINLNYLALIQIKWKLWHINGSDISITIQHLIL
jgi:hypothetical protein